MLTSVRSLMAATVLAGSAFVAAPAMANGGAGIELSGNAAVVSDYRFRGVSLSDGDIAIQGGVDAALPAGFYIGTWGSSIEEGDGTGYGHTELDVYGGWSGEFGAFSTDVGVLFYLYPNAVPGSFDYYEFYGSLGVGVGPADVAFGVAYAPDQDSLGDADNLYLYLDAGLGIPETPISVSAHVGYTDGVLAPDLLAGGIDQTGLDWSLGADVALGDVVSVGVAYIGTEGLDVDDFTDDAFVLTLAASF